MKKSLTAKIFLLLALALCLVPSVGMLVHGPAEARANESAARAPELTGRDGALNADYLSELADYAGEGFYLRGELITLYARALALFGRSAEDGVVLGTGGWLYYADELPDYSGTEPMTEREIFSAARNLSLMREYCEGLGAQFLFFIAPNKSSLYPQHMPGSYPRAEGAGNAQRLHAALAEEGVPFIDLFALFGAEAEELYFAHDSHWNSRGAAPWRRTPCSPPSGGRGRTFPAPSARRRRTAATSSRCSIPPRRTARRTPRPPGSSSPRAKISAPTA